MRYLVTMAFTGWNRTAVGAALGLSLAAASGGVGPAPAGVGAWTDGTMASARLIAEGIGEDGRLSAGIEIVLPPGWKTYWRHPGDSGIAPLIDFSASDNVGAASVRFPTPERYDDGYTVTNVYRDRVVLPVTLPVVDRDRDIGLKARIDLGVCDEICVPETLDLALDISAADRDAYAARVLATARAALPAAPEPGVFSVLAVSRDGGDDVRPVLAVNAVVPAAETADVFVGGPDGWYPGIPAYAGRSADGALYRVEISRLASSVPVGDAELVLVIVSDGRAIEQRVGVD